MDMQHNGRLSITAAIESIDECDPREVPLQAEPQQAPPQDDFQRALLWQIWGENSPHQTIILGMMSHCPALLPFGWYASTHPRTRPDGALRGPCDAPLHFCPAPASFAPSERGLTTSNIRGHVWYDGEWNEHEQMDNFLNVNPIDAPLWPNVMSSGSDLIARRLMLTRSRNVCLAMFRQLPSCPEAHLTPDSLLQNWKNVLAWRRQVGITPMLTWDALTGPEQDDATSDVPNALVHPKKRAKRQRMKHPKERHKEAKKAQTACDVDGARDGVDLKDVQVVATSLLQDVGADSMKASQPGKRRTNGGTNSTQPRKRKSRAKPAQEGVDLKPVILVPASQPPSGSAQAVACRSDKRRTHGSTETIQPRERKGCAKPKQE